jgi:hypothetical protein
MSQLELLEQYRDALRLAAVGALLHNLGKISRHFIERQLGIGSPHYLYQHIVQLVNPHCASLPPGLRNGCTHLAESDVLQPQTKAALSSPSVSLPHPFDDRVYVSGDLIEYLGQGEPWYQKNSGQFGIEHIFPKGSRLTHLMNRAHRGASGGEKQDIATAQQPDAHRLWLSTPFGWEVPAPSLSDSNSSTHPDIDDLKRQVEAIIQQYLTSPAIPLPLDEIIQDLHHLFIQAIADTQRPLNDITIWDIGHTGMALLVTQVTGLMLQSKSICHDDLAKVEGDNQLFWRVLSARTDGLSYLQTTSIADLRVRQRLLSEAYDRVQEELASLPVGIEVYRDENGSFYLFPDVGQSDAPFQEVQNKLNAVCEVDGLKLATMLSSQRLASHPKDAGIYIGDYINGQSRQLPHPAYALERIQQVWGDNKAVRDICTACHLRPQGFGAEQITAYAHNPCYYREKAEKRNICCICMERRSGVAQAWATGKLGQQTIWIDEVADANGRVALITGCWQLEDFTGAIIYPYTNAVEEKIEWLLTVEFFDSEPDDGTLFQLRNSQFRWDGTRRRLVGDSEINSFRIKQLKIHNPTHLNITLQDIYRQGSEFVLEIQEDLTGVGIGVTVKCWGQDFVVEDRHLLKTRTQQARDKVLQTVLWGNRYPFKVHYATRTNYISFTNNSNGVMSQSFTRLRRIWDTTHNFWQQVFPTDESCDVSQSIAGKNIDRAAARLEIKAQLRSQDENNPNPGDYHAYNLVLNGNIKMSVVWDPEYSRFITADNLIYLAQPAQLGQSVQRWLDQRKDAWFSLEEPSGYGSRNKVWGEIQIQTVHEIPNSSYVPAIPILAEPRSFMALVPADRSLDILQQIKRKYEREMGKVRNRLPLHLGAVYFSRRTPLRAALDAGQAMLQRRATPQPWRVMCIQVGTLPSDKLQLADGTSQFQHTITLTLEHAGITLTWCVPAVMGDGATPDNWYPYVFFQQDTNGNTQPAGRRRAFNDTHGHWLIHAGDLQVGDQILFTPSTFDFEFLDTTSRRFEIHYGDDGRRVSRPTRPFYLEDLDRLELLWRLLEQLERSQRYQVVATIEATRELWYGATSSQPDDEVFTQFVHDTLAGAAWPHRRRWDAAQHAWVDRANDDPQPGGWRSIPRDWQRQLIQAGVRGELADLLELRMEILKER